MGFQGQVLPLPIGQLGLSGSRNISLMQPGHLLEANNVSFEDRTLRKEGGMNKYNESALEDAGGSAVSILGGHDWHPSDGVQRAVIFTSEGELLKDDGSGTFSTSLETGLSTGEDVAQFVEGGAEAAANDRKLFFFSLDNPVRVIIGDATTTTSITSPPTDWSSPPMFGLIHVGRLWAGGNLNDPHRLYYSDPTDHEDFGTASSGTIPVFPGEGERLVNAFSFKGLIVAFKRPKGIYIIDTRSVDTADWSVRRLSGALGTLWSGTVAPILNDMLFIDQSGEFRLLSGIEEFGDLASQSLSEIHDIAPIVRQEMSISNAKKWKALWYPLKREAHFAMTTLGESTNRRRIVVDFNDPQVPKFRMSDRDTVVSMWLREEDFVERPVFGDDEGFVWQADRSTRNKDGEGYEALITTPPDDFSSINPRMASVNKQGMFLELVAESKGNWQAAVDIFWDEIFRTTVFFDMGATGAVLGEFELGVDALGGARVTSQKRRIIGSGKRFSLSMSNGGLNQDISIAQFLLHFKLMAEDKQGQST